MTKAEFKKLSLEEKKALIIIMCLILNDKVNLPDEEHDDTEFINNFVARHVYRDEDPE